MKRRICISGVVILGLAAMHSDAFGRGFGGFGGFHGGGFGGGFGGFHAGGFEGGVHAGGFGGSGGFRTGGFDAGGFHAGGYDAGGMRAGGFESGGYRAGGFESGGYRAGGYGAEGYRAGGYGESLNRGQLNSFLGLPTDSGMHAAGGAMAGGGAVAGPEGAAAWRGGATGHVYEGPMGTTVAHGTAGVQGAAVGPGGVAAGGAIAHGTAVEGPRGNVYASGAVAGRGFAAGSQGVVAGRGVVAGGGYAGAYGTRNWSATYCHAQGLAAQRWVGGSGVFTPNWAAAHTWAWHPAGYDAAAWATAAWRTAAWPAVGTWLAWTVAPAYYDYGNNITYASNNVYYGSQPVATTEQYYQEAVGLAGLAATEQTADAAQPSSAAGGDAQWLPLGVFGLMGQDQKRPEMLFQLTVDKQGVLRGNYYDQIADTTVPVAGAIDKKNQRVAWRIGSNKSLVVETGLYDLTLDRSTALVHYGPDRTQQYVLVRLKQPGQQAK